MTGPLPCTYFVDMLNVDVESNFELQKQSAASFHLESKTLCSKKVATFMVEIDEAVLQ